MQAFTDLQARLTEQYKGVAPEGWAQMMNMQNPVVQGMMGSYMEQSKSVFDALQQQMQKQTEQMLGAFSVKR
jgi:polyhydroxyalkanoate synthesis regulator protein